MMRHRTVWLVLLALLAASTLCAAEASSGLERVTAALEGGREVVRVVAFGDSITGVYYHTGGRRAWADMLAIALTRAYPKARVEMHNAGISGNTSAAGLARIDKDVLARKPHLVVVMFGMNDTARAKREQFQINLKTIVARCRQAGAAVVLCTPNDVYENPQRPIARLAEFAQTVRDVARELKVPLADCYRAYADLHTGDPVAWKLLMSETIHPSMNGHKLFAEVMAAAISGKWVSLADVQPPPDVLRFTLTRLRAGQPVSLIAMPPYDRLVPDALRKLFPKAEVKVTPWPTEGQSLAQLEAWGKQVRKQVPTLVVVAVPAGAKADSEEAYIRSYSWVLALSVDFGIARWDRVAILPSVTGPVSPEQKKWEQLARKMILGGDSGFIERPAGDARPAAAIVEDWVRHQAKIVP